MTHEERKALAEQITSNPLYDDVLSAMERQYLDQIVNADIKDDELRARLAAEVRAIRAFRSNLEAALQDNRPRKNAPA